MFVGIARIEILISHAHSLKEKRQVVKKIIDQVHNRFQVSVAEVDDQELWQKAVVGFALVSGNSLMVKKVIQKIPGFIETLNVCEIIDVSEEVFSW